MGFSNDSYFINAYQSGKNRDLTEFKAGASRTAQMPSGWPDFLKSWRSVRRASSFTISLPLRTRSSRKKENPFLSVIEITEGMYGDLQGIAGGAIPEIAIPDVPQREAYSK